MHRLLRDPLLHRERRLSRAARHGALAGLMVFVPAIAESQLDGARSAVRDRPCPALCGSDTGRTLDSEAAALQPTGPRSATPELRVDLTSGSVTKAELGAGLSVQPGVYFRMAIAGSAGAAWREGEQTGSTRLELQARFHLDPYRESAVGAYGVGGIAAAYDGFDGWQPRLVLGFGVELPSSARATWALEVALAGGVRITAALRGVRPGQR